jgi:hypothetical protein
VNAPIFCAWRDNILASATLTAVSATEDSEFPLDGLVDADPATPAKLTGTSGMVVADCGSAVHLTDLLLVHHNLDASLAVDVRGYASMPTDIGDAPDFSLALTPLATDNYGYRPNLRADIHTQDPSASYQYWALAVTGTNSRNLIFGELFGPTARVSGPRGFAPGLDTDVDVAVVTNRTYAGVRLTAAKGFAQRRWTGESRGRNSAYAAMEAFFLCLGGAAQPFLYVTESGEAVLAAFAQDGLRRRRLTPTGSSWQLTIEELSRGLAWA